MNKVTKFFMFRYIQKLFLLRLGRIKSFEIIQQKRLEKKLRKGEFQKKTLQELKTKPLREEQERSSKIKSKKKVDEKA